VDLHFSAQTSGLHITTLRLYRCLIFFRRLVSHMRLCFPSVYSGTVVYDLPDIADPLLRYLLSPAFFLLLIPLTMSRAPYSLTSRVFRVIVVTRLHHILPDIFISFHSLSRRWTPRICDTVVFLRLCASTVSSSYHLCSGLPSVAHSLTRRCMLCPVLDVHNGRKLGRHSRQ